MTTTAIDDERPGPAAPPAPAARKGPRTGWSAFAVGLLVSLPLLALHSPRLLGDADSARIVAAVRHVELHGPGYLVDTQEVVGPLVLLTPMLAVGGLAAAKLWAIVSLQLATGVVAWLAHRLSGSLVAAAGAALAFLAMAEVQRRALYLPMYPTMLALGYLGCWLAHRAMAGRRPWWFAAGAAACLVMSLEAHGVGQLLMLGPALMALTAPDARAGVLGALRVYGIAAVLLVPRAVVNLSEGGLSGVRTTRTDFWAEKGYLRQVQIRFWGYPGIDEPLGEYVVRWPARFVESPGPWGWVAVVLAAAALVHLDRRGRAVAGLAAVLLAAAMTVERVAPTARYFSPLWPGVAVLAGLAVGRIAAGWARRPRPEGSRVGRVVAAAVLLVLVAVATASLRTIDRSADLLAANVEARPFAAYAAIVAERGGAVIGARSHSLVSVDPDIETYGGQFLTEDEYVTYLTWPSDEAVIEVMRRHDIRWAFVHRTRALEQPYHDAWLVDSHGARARHVEALQRSPNFCLVADDRGYLLYELGPCDETAPPPSVDGRTGS